MASPTIIKVRELDFFHDIGKLCIRPPRLGEQIAKIYEIHNAPERDKDGKRIYKFQRSGFSEETEFGEDDEIVLVRE